MNNNNGQVNDTDTALGLFAGLNANAQDAAMNLIRVGGAIREGVLPSDMRELVTGFVADAFDAGAGQGGAAKAI